MKLCGFARIANNSHNKNNQSRGIGGFNERVINPKPLDKPDHNVCAIVAYKENDGTARYEALSLETIQDHLQDPLLRLDQRTPLKTAKKYLEYVRDKPISTHVSQIPQISDAKYYSFGPLEIGKRALFQEKFLWEISMYNEIPNNIFEMPWAGHHNKGRGNDSLNPEHHKPECAAHHKNDKNANIPVAYCG